MSDKTPVTMRRTKVERFLFERMECAIRRAFNRGASNDADAWQDRGKALALLELVSYFRKMP